MAPIFGGNILCPDFFYYLDKVALRLKLPCTNWGSCPYDEY